MLLGSGVAVAVSQASSCRSDSTPSPGTSTCHRCCCKKKKKKEKKERKWLRNYICGLSHWDLGVVCYHSKTDRDKILEREISWQWQQDSISKKGPLELEHGIAWLRITVEHQSDNSLLMASFVHPVKQAVQVSQICKENHFLNEYSTESKRYTRIQTSWISHCGLVANKPD